MTNLRMSVLICVLAMSLLVAGCGDDGPGEFQSSLDGDLEASSMGNDDVDAFCDEMEEYMEDNLDIDELECMGIALVMAFFSGSEDEAEATCEETYSACLAGELDDEFEEDELVCELKDMDLSQCDASVEEMEACVVETTEELNEFMNQFSCGSVFELIGEEEDLGPACQVVDDKCPGFI